MEAMNNSDSIHPDVTEWTNCNLCQSNDYTLLYIIPDLMLNKKDVASSLVRCKQCGLVYQNPRPTSAQMASNYPPEYDPFNIQKEQKQPGWLGKKAFDYGLSKRCNFVTRFKTGGRLLDVGCATGEFLGAMSKRKGWQLHGVEINPQAALVAIECYHLEIFTGVLEQAGYPNQYFDVITLWEVLEHLHDPNAALSEIRRILKPDGILVIRTPDLSSWDARFFGKYWSGYDAPRHLYIFNPITLEKILKLAGFYIQSNSYRMGGYASFMISINFWMSGVELKSSTRYKVQRILGNPIINLILALLYNIVGQFLRGPTLTTAARRFENEQMI
jgi:2-polyprenyl-3-methyl-5-hydroxy-6-metoxy-1,4-benzoquinol methylase